MAKYHKLVQEHTDGITEIKALQAKYDSLAEQLKASPWLTLHPNPDWTAIDQFEGLADEAAQVHDDLIIAYELLHQDIEAEYANVPFELSRRQGVDGFWREAGLEQSR